jgi:hypothetical protein
MGAAGMGVGVAAGELLERLIAKITEKIASLVRIDTAFNSRRTKNKRFLIEQMESKLKFPPKNLWRKRYFSSNQSGCCERFGGFWR